jgi:lathosterol oxidase
MIFFSSHRGVNGAAHHDLHHSQFTVNYGQFFTFWDRVCGTHLDPNEDVMKTKKKNQKTH